VEDLGDGRLASVVFQLYVFPEYRGLGLAHTLFAHYCRLAYDDKIEILFLELPGSSDFLEGMMEAHGARRMAQTYELNITRWYQENVDIP
jgi:GNAT superfamily N-acetyltransferase